MIYTKIETSGKEELSGWEWHPFEAKGSRGGDPGSDRYGKAYAPYKEIQNPKHKTEKHKEIYAGVQDLSSGGNYATAWMSLFMQSPFGELPTGFRSSHHIWNEAEQCVIFEIYASEYAKLGYTKEAGAFKRAAMLSLGSISQWIREDGSGYIVKNRYPKEARHGYEKYSVHTCYNMLACSMLAQAWQNVDGSWSSLAEQKAEPQKVEILEENPGSVKFQLATE